MLARLLALFLITPVVELALLIQLGQYIGFWPTVGIIVLTGLIGSLLAKREGLGIWRRFNERLQAGEIPGEELLDGVIILVSGALLITPGVFTDLFGFIGLIPFTRAVVRKAVNRRIQRGLQKGTMSVMFGGLGSFGAAGGFGEAPPGADPARSYGGTQVDRGPAAGEDAAAWRGRPRDVPGYEREE